MRIRDLLSGERASGPGRNALGRLRRIVPALVVVAAAIPLAALSAQQSPTAPPPVRVLKTEAGDVPITGGRSGFSLMAFTEDFAATGMHMTGTLGWYFPNNGPCPSYPNGGQPLRRCGLVLSQTGGVTQMNFEISMMAGAPITDFRKIRAVYPGVANMKGVFGYTAPYTFFLATPRADRWGAADGQFGNLFSGVVSTSGDGSCKDNSSYQNGFMDAKITLLAGSDCPETWARVGFQGPRPVLETERVRAFQASPNTFHFDDYKLPASAFDTTQFLGNFSTYGVSSDYYREQIQAYGGVTKLAAGAPSLEGFPLGLDAKFDAWQFGRPVLQNIVFWRVRLINNSAKVYGTGVDFDSLYYALEPGALGNAGQQFSGYADFKRNALLLSHGNDSRKCSATFPRRIPGVITAGCPQTAINTQPFEGIMVLKSPIGDAKNRLLSTVGSPYYNPTSPFADDTITFQHIRRASFGANYNLTVAANDQVRFGLMSSIESNTIGGRDLATTFTTAQLFQLFQSENFDIAKTPAENARYNRFVPGSTAGYGKWDFNNDGVQDTIFVPTCGVRGCVTNYADTLPNGMQDILGNVGNILGTGPFKLKAGDTTEFLYAFVGAADSSSFEGYINNGLAAYLNNFLGPSAYPAPTFTASDVSITNAAIRDSTLARQDVQVNIRIRQAAPFDDPYLKTVVARLSDTTATSRRLRSLNPTLLATVQQRLRNNLDLLYIYKSCDNGRNFIVRNNNCATTDAGNSNGAPIDSIRADSTTGRLTRNQFSDVVSPGRSYLYSFVTKTRGLGDIRIVDSVGGRVVSATLASAIQTDTGSLRSPLARSGPTTVTVYAPISAPAGTVYGFLDTVRVSGTSTQRLSGTVRSSVVPGVYTAAAANRFIVQLDVDTLRGSTTTTVIAQRLLGRASTTPSGANSTTSFVADQDVYVSTAATTTLTVDKGDNPLTPFVPTLRSRSGSVLTYLDTLNSVSATGYILARQNGVGVGSSQPYFIALNTAAVTTASFESSTAFPGFFVTPTQEATPRTLVTLRGPGDTLSTTVIASSAVTLQNPATAIRGFGGGRYEVRWAGDSYGPGVPFLITDVATLQPQVTASLLGRAIADSTRTDTQTVRLVRGTPGASATRPLVSAKVPFTVFTRDGKQATLAMFRRNVNTLDSLTANSVLFGQLGDTIRVQVPADVWVPGDTLYVIERSGRDSTVLVGTNTVTVVQQTVITSTVPNDTIFTPIVSNAPFVGAVFQLGCSNANTNPARLSCNPIALQTRGATSYRPYEAGYVTIIDIARPLDLFTEFRLNASAQTALTRTLTKTETNRILVVPNPYVVSSATDNVDAARTITARIYFTNVPESGSMRIYSVSGQFVQQLRWTAADLVRGTAQTLTGDLPYNLRSREGLELSSGLYIFVLTPQGASSGSKPVRGKFVVIR